MKDAVLFSPKDKEKLIDLLQMDTYEPPMTQVIHNIFYRSFYRFFGAFIGMKKYFFRRRVGSVCPN